ncbi:hypothetical protein IWW48_005352 [Coemansia sp. RSA 1200]|nr:hypothetical protein IWW48_005352 [Coemansia sp. RSA 1200]
MFPPTRLLPSTPKTTAPPPTTAAEAEATTAAVTTETLANTENPTDLHSNSAAEAPRAPKSQQERNRVRAIRRRERETSEERTKRRETERIRAAARRRNESPTEGEVRRRKGRLRAMRRREKETDEEKNKRRELNRIRMAERRREMKKLKPNGDDSRKRGAGGTVQNEFPQDCSSSGDGKHDSELVPRSPGNHESKQNHGVSKQPSKELDGHPEVAEPARPYIVPQRTRGSAVAAAAKKAASHVSAAAAAAAASGNAAAIQRNTLTALKSGKERKKSESLDQYHHASSSSYNIKKGAPVNPVETLVPGPMLTPQPINTSARDIALKRKSSRLQIASRSTPALTPTSTSTPMSRPVQTTAAAASTTTATTAAAAMGAIEESAKHHHHSAVAIESLLSDAPGMSSRTIMKTLGPNLAFSTSALPPMEAQIPARRRGDGGGSGLAFQQPSYRQPLPPMLSTAATIANANAAAAAAAAVVAAAAASGTPSTTPQFNISQAQTTNAMHSLVGTGLGIPKQNASMDDVSMMFQNAAAVSQAAAMQQIMPPHIPSAAAAAAAAAAVAAGSMGIGSSLPSAITAASFAPPGLVVGPLSTFAQPAAVTSLAPTSLMAPLYASQTMDGTIASDTTSAAALPASTAIGSNSSGGGGGHAPGRTIGLSQQFRYNAPQITRSQIQEASDSLLGMTMTGGGSNVSSSAILQTQAAATDSMAAAVAAAAASAAAASSTSHPDMSSVIAPIHRFGHNHRSASIPSHSVVQRHDVNQTQNLSPHHSQIPNVNSYYYIQR